MTSPVQAAGGRREARWTRDNIIEKIREWVAMYGEPPRAADWNPSSAKWSGATWRIERYRSGDWPSLNATKKAFGGSLNAAIIAAGFEPNKPGPVSRREVASPELVVGRVEMPPEARAALNAAIADMKAAQDRVAVRDRQLARAQETCDRLRSEVELARRATAAAERARSKVVTRTETKTQTKTVRVPDSAAVNRLAREVERLRSRLDDREAVLRSEKDRGAAAARDLKAMERKLVAAEEAVAESRAAAASAVRDRNALADRLVAAQRASEKVVVREVKSASDSEVAEARKAAHEAEVRAARAERKFRELEALVTGGDRRLTPDEIAELRKGGPSGPGVLMKAVKDVVEARAQSPAALPAALTKLASAAVRWRESL